MNRRYSLRGGGTLLLLAGLVLGLVRCAEEPTRSGEGFLELRLQRPAEATAGTIDTLAAEVWASGRRVAVATTEVDSQGRFDLLLTLGTAEPYQIALYASGPEAEAWPEGSLGRGVRATGAAGGVRLLPGRLQELRVPLASTAIAPLGVDGLPGESSLQAWWPAVSEATGYQLSWYRAASGAVTEGAVVADTSALLAWPGGAGAGGMADSVLFRARPVFGERVGAYGAGLWRDLSLWLDLPCLVTLSPAAGATVPIEDLQVRCEFDRAMAETTLASGILWERLPEATTVPFTVSPEGAAPTARFALVPEVGALVMGVDYRVRVTSAVRDLRGRPFDADTLRTGLQDTLAVWSTAPYDPVHVLEVVPEAAAREVPRTTGVRLVLSRAIDPASLDSASVRLRDERGARPVGDWSVAPGGDTLTWQPQAPYLWYATVCTVQVSSALRAADGSPFDQDPGTVSVWEPFRAHFTTETQPEGPRVTTLEPAPGSVGVPRSSGVRLTFSEPLDTLSVQSTSSLRVLREGQIGIPGAIAPEAAQTRFLFTPRDPFEPGQRYEVRAAGELSGGVAGVTDLEGHPLDQDRGVPGYQTFSAWFRAEDPPSVSALTFQPAGPDTFFAVDGALALRFSGPIDPASADDASVRLEQAGVPVPATLSVSTDSLQIELAPTGSLAWLTRCTVTVDTLLRGADGSGLDQDLATLGREAYQARFTTEPESLHPRVVVAQPLSGDTLVSVTETLRVVLEPPIDPATVTPATLTLTRLSGAGAPAPVAGTIAASAGEARFEPEAALAYQTDYELRLTTEVHDPTGLFALDQDPETPGLQPFVSSWRTDRERIPPRVSTAHPDDGASELPRATVVTVIFTEAMHAASVADAFLFSAGATPVAGSGALGPDERTWTFTPVALDWLTTYTAGIDTTAQDLAGNALDQDPLTPGAQSWSIQFTTEPDRIAPRVTWVDPESASTQVALDAHVRIGFSESLAAGTVTPDAFHVQAAGSDVPGRTTLEEGQTVLAWSPVSLPDSLAALLAFGTTYTVVAEAWLTDLAGNALDQDAGQAGHQPFSSFFSTLPETLAPRVAALLPDTQEVALDTTLTLVFTEAMDTLSLAEAGVVSLERDGASVACTRVFGAGGSSITLRPVALLEPGVRYEVRVDTLARDLAGNRLDQEPAQPGRQAYVQGVHTEADQIPPAVLTVAPANGAHNVNPDTTITITFSEPLNPTTVHEANILLTGPGGLVSLASGPSLDETGRVVQMEPAGSLNEGEDYVIVVSRLVSDLAGNRMAASFSSVFAIGWRPVIVWEGGQCLSGVTAGVVFDASGSYDPDGSETLATAIWDWGDGGRDTLAAPAGLTAAHTYTYVDVAGCDGIDNDGDGEIDEAGPLGCDESYRVTLTLQDQYGFARTESTGVAFCAFLVLRSEPPEGGLLDAHNALRLEFTHPVAAASLDSAVALLRLADGIALDSTLTVSAIGPRVYLAPPETWLPGDYQLWLGPALTDTSGTSLDQLPEQPGSQAFELLFTVPGKPSPPLDPDPNRID